MTRAEIIEYLYDNNVHGDLKIEDMADDLAEPQWIPCSKRLPDFEEKSYWVCTRTGRQFSCKWKRYEPMGNWAWHTTATVIAWMPLPEPYKDGE